MTCVSADIPPLLPQRAISKLRPKATTPVSPTSRAVTQKATSLKVTIDFGSNNRNVTEGGRPDERSQQVENATKRTSFDLSTPIDGDIDEDMGDMRLMSLSAFSSGSQSDLAHPDVTSNIAVTPGALPQPMGNELTVSGGSYQMSTPRYFDTLSDGGYDTDSSDGGDSQESTGQPPFGSVNATQPPFGSLNAAQRPFGSVNTGQRPFDNAPPKFSFNFNTRLDITVRCFDCIVFSVFVSQ